MRCLHPPFFCCIGCAEILPSPVLPGLCARQERPAGREKSLLFPAETDFPERPLPLRRRTPPESDPGRPVRRPERGEQLCRNMHMTE